MVEIISAVLRMRPVYTFMPACSYVIDNITVDKHGALIWDGRTNDSTIMNVRNALSKAGFKAAAVTTTAMKKGEAKSEKLAFDAYFKNMERIEREYYAAKEAREAEKKQILETKGWDSEELSAWNEREKQFTPPYTMGQISAFSAWENSKRSKSGELECDTLPFEKDIRDFSDTLKEAGYKTLVITDQSTALMQSLHALGALGWKIDGLCSVTRAENYSMRAETREVQGLRLTIN